MWSRAALVLVAHLSVAGDRSARTPPQLDGIDVSAYQGAIDWRRVRRAGITFAFIRASDGLDIPDDTFGDNFRGARQAGVRRGAYQYFRAGQDPLAQADLIVSSVRRHGRADLPPVADVETDDGQPDATLQANLYAWLARVEKRTHRRPIIYTSPSMGARLAGRFADWPLWVAHYEVDAPRLPDGWTRWTFWQHSSTGRVDGIAGNVDLDRFAGNRAALRRLDRRVARPR